MLAVLTDEEAGPVVGEISAHAQREQLSKYLPYRTYDRDTRRFRNVDNTEGLIWECRPLTFYSPKALESLAGLLRQEMPDGFVLQVILFPDDNVEHILQEYRNLKKRGDALSTEAASRYAQHLKDGRKGVRKMSGIPVRNFRLFVVVKCTNTMSNDRVSTIEEALRQTGFAPRAMDAAGLLALLRPVFNDHVPTYPGAYDDTRYLCKQIIDGETAVTKHGNYLKIGSRLAACITPKTLPTGEYLDGLQMNRVIGGYGGKDDDATQLAHRFIWTTTVFFHTEPSALRKKASVMMAQKAGGSIAKSIGRRTAELSWVLDDLEKDRYVNVISSMWVFGNDQEDLDRGVARARNLWEQQGFVMQRETHLMLPLLLVALPFGLYVDDKNVETIDRDFTISCNAAAHLLPVQADFSGYMRPVLLYVGRKGQLASIDVFDPNASNQNFYIAAGTGGGKSFLLNNIVQNYYGTDAKIRVMDIGFSYEKQCATVKGRFIDVAEQSGKLCLNPFHSVAKDAEDRKHDELSTATILLTMAFSNTGLGGISETHWSLGKDAVRAGNLIDGGELGVTHAQAFLSGYPKTAEKLGLPVFDGAIPVAHEMAFNLRDFTRDGKHGRLFNGRSSLDISSDEFVVVELENLINDRELFQVISMQAINALTQDLYLSDRTRKSFNLFDEAWKYFSSAKTIADMIEEMYRRARKYGGATGIVTQSILDLKMFGPAGSVIRNNSAFKFFLESDSFAAAVKEGLLEYEGLLLDLARSVKNNKPNYSEILFDTPFGCGVGRLCVDDWTYWMNTSTAHEVARFKGLIARGLTASQALAQLAA